MNAPDQLPGSAWGVVRLFETSRAGIDTFSDQLILGVQNGEIDPLELRVFIKSMEMILERANEETKKNQLTAADLYPEMTFKAFGAEVTKADHVQYKYEGCNDPEWIKAKEVVKEREAFLKALKAPIDILDKDSGEVITINPPKVIKTPGLKISIK